MRRHEIRNMKRCKYLKKKRKEKENTAKIYMLICSPYASDTFHEQPIIWKVIMRFRFKFDYWQSVEITFADLIAKSTRKSQRPVDMMELQSNEAGE